MPKISPAQEQQRREQILAAATVCFARQGYHATSMDDVVRQSGLSVGAIYTYFPSKEELFLALGDRRTEQTLSYLNELFRRPGPIADKSREAVDYFFRSLSDELLPLARVTVEFLAEAGKSERIQERQQRRCESIRQFLHWLLSDAQARGELRSDVDIDASVGGRPAQGGSRDAEARVYLAAGPRARRSDPASVRAGPGAGCRFCQWN